jgi:hypothetical protein
MSCPGGPLPRAGREQHVVRGQIRQAGWIAQGCVSLQKPISCGRAGACHVRPLQGLRLEALHEEGQRHGLGSSISGRSPSDGHRQGVPSWRQRLDRATSFPSRERAEQFLEEVALPPWRRWPRTCNSAGYTHGHRRAATRARPSSSSSRIWARNTHSSTGSNRVRYRCPSTVGRSQGHRHLLPARGAPAGRRPGIRRHGLHLRNLDCRQRRRRAGRSHLGRVRSGAHCQADPRGSLRVTTANRRWETCRLSARATTVRLGSGVYTQASGRRAASAGGPPPASHEAADKQESLRLPRRREARPSIRRSAPGRRTWRSGRAAPEP